MLEMQPHGIAIGWKLDWKKKFHDCLCNVSWFLEFRLYLCGSVSSVMAWKRAGAQCQLPRHICLQRYHASTLEMRPHGIAIGWKLDWKKKYFDCLCIVSWFLQFRLYLCGCVSSVMAATTPNSCWQ